ncbi:MAG: hypothetical protein IMZ64_07990 [Bacteroidetes bacterium]|nr:hypothetical protein [Bacteroidota bacterium]
MSKKNEDNRAGKIITLGKNRRAKFPTVFDTVYRIKTDAVADEEDVDKDETFKLHTLVTVDVEGVTIVDGGRAVSINGEFEISAEEDGVGSDEEELRDKTWSDKDEAIAAWLLLTEAQIRRCKKMKDKIDQTLVTLETSRDDRQY